MNSNRSRCIVTTLGAAACGLLAAAFLPMTIAHADEYVYTPDLANYSPEPGEYPYATGVGEWNTDDITDHTQVLDTLSGQGPEVSYGYSSYDVDLFDVNNELFTVSADMNDPGGLASGSVIDLTNLFIGEASSGVYANELIDAAAGSTTPGLTDILLTPTGDFVLF
jgi:hypothetical protein